MSFNVGDVAETRRGPIDKPEVSRRLRAPLYFFSLFGATFMVSSTQQFERIRKRKMTTSGKRNKRDRRRIGTPAFPIHQTGYDAKAADAPRKDAK
jgi:hypothetical protein